MSFAQRWKQAGADDIEEFDPPDGNYTVTVAAAKVWQAPDGREFCKITLRIVEGEHEGRHFADFTTISNEVGMKVAKRNLSVYGLDVDRIQDREDLEAMVPELVGNGADVSVVHNDRGYTNVNAHVGRPTNGQTDVRPDLTDFEPAPAQSDDDIPF